MAIYTVDVFSGSSDGIIQDANAQGVIVKATQGNTYVNPRCNHQVDLTHQLGKLLGLYHYAGGGNPENEAQYFINNIKNYVGQGPLFLDWEQAQNASWGDTSWARRFVNEVHRLTGVWAGIYVQESAIWQVASCADVSALWVAKYPSMNWHSWTVPNMNVSSGSFQFITGWQFAGDDRDRSIFYLDEVGWNKLGNPDGKQAPTENKPTPTPAPVSVNTWTDSLGDKWTEEKGTFTTNQPINLRWGAKTSSALITTLPAGSDIKYDAYSRHDGFVWLRQPRGNGQYGYLVCRDANTNEAFGTFSK